MRFEDFRERAVGEGLRYKEDRMVFLRELAQNSRDAGARKVGVSALIDGDDVVIAVGDDGSGMTFEHARKFLFTLYASSKEDEDRSAGRFGVGFWSVLLFDPHSVIIESATADGEAWAVALDGALREPRRVECGLHTPGTRITLRKRAIHGEGQRVLLETERALGKYCRYLRRNDRAASVLPVHLNGKRIDKPFAVGGPCWLAFRDGAVEGAVGLGERPRVELYARGILVWRGTSIDELRHGALPTRDRPFAEGLAPVYVLCGNDLSVTLDRRAVVDDRALSRVRLAARRRMRELTGLYLDGLSPRPLHRRIWGWIAGRFGDLRAEPRPGPWVVLAAVLFVLAILAAVLPRLVACETPARQGGAAPATVGSAAAASVAPAPDRPVPLGLPPPFDGPLVHPLGLEARTFLGYSPADRPLLLRLVAAEDLHPGRGPRSAPRGALQVAPGFRCAAGCVAVETVVDSGPGILHLPVPTGHRIDTGSVWLGDAPVRDLRMTSGGQAAIELSGPIRAGLVYRTGPSPEPLEPGRRRALLEAPEAAGLPPDFAAAVGAALALPEAADRVELLRAFVERRIAYDRSPKTAAEHGRRAAGDPKGGWLDFVAGQGRGDCDVKNGLLVLLARRAGVPARLAIGFSGLEGRAQPGLHAWAEYHDRGWLAADATGPSIPPGATAVPPPEPAASAPEAMVTPPFSGDRRETPAARPPWLVPLISAAAAVALFSVLAGVFLLLAGRVSRKLVAPGGSGTRRRVAAEMLSGALVRPENWSGTGGLTSRPLLPLLGDRGAMSLDECLERGRRVRLWYSAGRTSLVRRLVAGGARILDAADPTFGDLAPRIPGGVDLDVIANLAPAGAARLHPDHRPGAAVIEEADDLAAAAGVPAGTLVPCPGLEGALTLDVDLRGLPVAGTGFPSRFVAVGVSHPEVRRRASLAGTDRILASFLLLDLVLARSGLLGPYREEIRRLAAARSLEVRA